MTLLRPGDVIGGRYRLVRVIGTGAMGVVWSARNERTERDFAIKLMTPASANDPARLSRFFKEAKLAGRLRHRSIVEVYDLGRIEGGSLAGAPYLVMELLDGEPLDGLLRRIGRLPAGTALRVVAEVARGLSIAHRQGIVHRDLKPANVFLHRSPELESPRAGPIPKILDFGISKLLPGGTARESFKPHETTTGTIVGSPAYMSPEQTSGEDLDPRADIWSLGVVLYKTLSGALPFNGLNFATLVLAINSAEPPPLDDRVPGLPRELYALVARCLSRRRGDRFADAAALARAIEDVLEAHELETIDLLQVIGEAGGAVELAPNGDMKTDSRGPDEDWPLTSDVIPPPTARVPRPIRSRVGAALWVMAIAAAALVGSSMMALSVVSSSRSAGRSRTPSEPARVSAGPHVEKPVDVGAPPIAPVAPSASVSAGPTGIAPLPSATAGR